MKIYIVTRGQYADYHILTLCIFKDQAEAIAAKFDGTEVEEHELDEWIPFLIGTHDKYQVCMDKNGIVSMTCGHNRWRFDSLINWNPGVRLNIIMVSPVEEYSQKANSIRKRIIEKFGWPESWEEARELNGSDDFRNFCKELLR